MTQGLAAYLEMPGADIGRDATEPVLAKLAEAARTWSQAVTSLAVWQDDNLLDDPSPGACARNLSAIGHLLRLGRLLGRVVEDEQFGDEPTRRMVAATMQTLQDMERLWASPLMPATEANAILGRVFPNVA